MLHQSSGRRSFGLVTPTSPAPFCPFQVANFFVGLKDQVKEAIACADKQEVNTSSLKSVPK